MSFNDDGKLTPTDLQMFSRLGIPAEIFTEAAKRVTDREAREKYGIVGCGDMSGIVFQYIDPRNGHRLTARVRRDSPEIEDGKPKNKYVSAYRDHRHLFFPPASGPSLGETSVPVIVVEAEKAALALAALSVRVGRPLLPVGCGGCWGWRGKIGIIPDAKGNGRPRRVRYGSRAGSASCARILLG